MSADSPRRGLHKGAQIISPQPISDRSIIDSVAGIINDIVPQAYAGAPNLENKESITWARFEYADVNNSIFYPDYIEGSATPPLLLVLGYTTGVQVWVVAASGEATEVLSWRQGVVRTLRILPDPKKDDDHADPFESKRPLVAICDSAGPGPQFCSVTFISLRTSEQAKIIKFKNPVCDVLANRRSVVVTLSEKIAVFDARTLEDVLTVTTCYPSPGPNPNPVALGTRWLAYSEKKLLPARRSSGGSEGEGVQSYTATVLYAAKSLGKGLRGLGETVASSLTGNSVMPMAMNNVGGDVTQPGVVTILDLQAAKEEKELDDPTIETVVAHFTAHNDAIVAITFDLTGALLMTADKRGHDFHVFRIQPHPGGPTLAAVHHLYVLHRGDTTAKVQDMTFSSDTRWAAVSTVRGTTHVFPVAPYGGPVGVRTHSTPHVVNRLSRFHRSAGLTDDGTRSHSPVSHAELPISVYPYSNPRLPPYPHPTILHPLAQIRQPSTLNHANSQTQPSRPQQRQRLHSEDSGTLPLKICVCFAPPRAWIYAQRDSTTKVAKRAVDSLFIMACHGNMIQYDLEPKPAAGVPKEKVCDDTTIELEVEAKGQWPLLRTPNSLEIVPPLPSSSPLLGSLGSPKSSRHSDTADDRWLSQVEIVTHAGPHRRLWMGPQFVFKTYNAPSGVNLIESEAVEIGVTGGSRPARSNPVNMPHAATRPLVPVVIDGSGSSYEQSPRFVEAYGDSLDNDTMGIGNGENQLREDLAEAMLETSAAPHRAAGRRLVVERVGQPVTKVVNPLGTVITVLADEEDVSSSQEFDDATPEPPRSVCAEEGPASLGDFDTEGQDLRNLTEICAEMRSASEPAIDSVPDESIRDVKERKTLCVEPASTTIDRGRKRIDFESAEAFRDVPTSLSLCAERGEIPNSPMTRARENNWNKRTVKREDSEVQERRTFAKAKYVVSYDEDSVVLMENKAAVKISEQVEPRRDVVPTMENDSPKLESSTKKTDFEPERPSKRPIKITPSTRANKRSTCGIHEQPKYVVHEHGDSIVIEDTTMPTKKVTTKKSEAAINYDESTIDVTETEKTDVISKNSSSGERATPRGESVTRDRRSRGKDRRNSNTLKTRTPSIETTGEVEPMVIESRQSDEKIETIESFVDVRDVRTIDADESTPTKNDPEPMEATPATGSASLPLEPLAVDEISSMDYHIVEAAGFGSKETVPSHQSDDEIEHIDSSEVNQMLEIVEKPERSDDFEISPIRQRKNSKSTISDDDLEHINSSELTEVLEESSTIGSVEKMLSTVKNDNDEFQTIAKPDKTVLGFDEDIEHVYHSEVTEIEGAFGSPTISAVSPKLEIRKKSIDNTSSDRQCSIRSRGSRKRKDVVVIDSDTSEAEVTVIVKSLEGWNKSKTPEKDLAEEIDRCVEPKEHCSDQTSSQSLPKKTRVRTGKSGSGTSNVQKRQSQSDSDMIEIIDIDAMQKAEMKVASECSVAPECKIFEPRHDPPSARSQKSRKNKKAHLETASNVESVDQSGVSPKRPNDQSNKVEAGEPAVESPESWNSVATNADFVGEPEPDRSDESSIAQPADVTVEITTIREIIEETDVAEANVIADNKNPKASKNDSRISGKCRSSSSEVPERVIGSKKRGKKTRVCGSDGEPAASSPIKNVTAETATVAGDIAVDEPARRELRASVEQRGTVEMVEKIAESAAEVGIADVRMSENPEIDPNSDSVIAASAIVASDVVVTPEMAETLEPEQRRATVETEIDMEPEKRNDSDHETAPERSSSSDDLNANVVPMDTEEDTAAREIAEKNGSTGVSPSWSAVNKKNTRSKKKKRR